MGRVNARRWPGAVVVMAVNSSAGPHSGSVRPAFRVDFGQFYKIIQYIISCMYMYMYMYYNRPSISPPFDVKD